MSMGHASALVMAHTSHGTHIYPTPDGWSLLPLVHAPFFAHQKDNRAHRKDGQCPLVRKSNGSHWETGQCPLVYTSFFFPLEG